MPEIFTSSETWETSGASNRTAIWWDERMPCNPTFFITQNGKSEYFQAVADSIRKASRSAKFADWLFVPSTKMTSEGLQLDELLWNKLEENENFRVYIYTYEMSLVNPVTGKWGPFYTGVGGALRDFAKHDRSKNRVSVLFASGREGKLEQYWSCHMKVVSIDDTEMYLGGVEWLDDRLSSFKGYGSWMDLQAHIPGGETVAHYTEVFESMWRTFCDDPSKPADSGSCDTATLVGLHVDKNFRPREPGLKANRLPATARSTLCSLELSGGHARLGSEIAEGGLSSHMGESLEGTRHEYQEAIYLTYVKALRAAGTVLIEDQYFSSGFINPFRGQVATNVIMSALEETKSAAIILPLSSAAAVPTFRAMVQWKTRQWNRSHNVSLEPLGWFNTYKAADLLKLDTLEAPHVDFFFLMHAGADNESGDIVLDQKFVHSKGLIALGGKLEYPLAVVGSANINDRSLLSNRDAEISVRIEGDGVVNLFAEKIAWYLAVSDDWMRRIMRKCMQGSQSECCKKVASDFLNSSHAARPEEPTSQFNAAYQGGVVQLLEKRGFHIRDSPNVVGQRVARSAYDNISQMTRKVGEVEELPTSTTEQLTQLLNHLWHQPDMLSIMSSLAALNADLLAAVSGGEVDVLRKSWHEVGGGPRFETLMERLVSVFKPSQERRLPASGASGCFELPVDALLLPFRLGLMKDMPESDLTAKIADFSVLEKGPVRGPARG